MAVSPSVDRPAKPAASRDWVPPLARYCCRFLQVGQDRWYRLTSPPIPPSVSRPRPLPKWSVPNRHSGRSGGRSGGIDLVRIVDSIHRDKNISKDILFEGIESALVTAAKKHYPDEPAEILVNIDRTRPDRGHQDGARWTRPSSAGSRPRRPSRSSSRRSARPNATACSTNSKIARRPGDRHRPAVRRGGRHGQPWQDRRVLPRSEQIPGESHHPNERVRAVIFDVRKVGPAGQDHPQPDPSRLRPPPLRAGDPRDRRPDHRDPGPGPRGGLSLESRRGVDRLQVDAVGACVGVRGTRIKNIVDELGGERIDIVRWNESLQVLIPNALQPAEIDEVMLCQLLGRAIVLVREISSRWPSAAGARMSGWPGSWWAGTSRS